MENSQESTVVIRNFSKAFEHICGFVAVSRTANPQGTIRALVCQILALFPEDKINEAIDVKLIIETMYGISIPVHEIKNALHSIVTTGDGYIDATGFYKIQSRISDDIYKKTEEVKKLESKVKSDWFTELGDDFEINHDQIWLVLRKYLSGAFRRHGIQTVALIKPDIGLAPEYSESLSQILNSALADELEKSQHATSRQAIKKFLADVSTNKDRAKYIAQLADGAYNYYSIAIPPETSMAFGKQLSEITLFFDTNFLFGILDLHTNPFADVSGDLLRVIDEHKLPFKLRYHEETKNEMMHAIYKYSERLGKRSWPKDLSRAVVKTQCLSGIEIKFHQQNSETGVDAASFMKKYEHFDVLLAEKDIKIFRDNIKRAVVTDEMYHDYKAFLLQHGKDKPYETIMHDMTVLDSVRKLRSAAPSTLEAKALIITCDYFLYRFDWEDCRKKTRRICTLLPNHFWQILRPFIANDSNFDTSFAETFALPEFRTLGSGALRACSKIVDIIAGLKDFPEETAVKILSNDLILDSLATKSDRAIEEAFETEVAKINTTLMEELTRAKDELEQKETEKNETKLSAEKNINELQLEIQNKEEQIAKHADEFKRRLDSTSSQLRDAEEYKKHAQAILETKAQETISAKHKLKDIEMELDDVKKGKHVAESKNQKMIIILSVVIFLFVIFVFEFVVFYVDMNPWNPMLKGFGFQGLFILLVALLMLSVVVSEWRFILLTSSVVAVLIAFILLVHSYDAKKIDIGDSTHSGISIKP